ncbi:MAG: hypothetical protein A2283_21885 [Lentisphaerae bacterium RIFOXYA12_FULL_48_11]|nr:MAG: hypothetical protein A2283_21885 [Lentisphaerae bacterium RIFOXYA12_FULL_48_11]
MKVCFESVILVMLLSLVLSAEEAQKPGFRGKIIPKPQEIQQGDGMFTLTEKTVIFVRPSTSEMKAIGQYLADFLAPATGLKLKVKSPWLSKLSGIVLEIDPSRKALGDEGYVLTCTQKGVTITAAKPAGIFYGIQTLRQLLPVQVESRQQVEGVEWTVPCVSIKDQPRFRWRGMLLDPARHFLSKEFLFKYIDIMAMHKLNRLHLHLTDSQGWRVEIKRYPGLVEVGARLPNFSGKTGEGWFYTQDDIRQIVTYAAGRYVAIIPEIEMPGHSGAAQDAFPEMLCTSPLRNSLCIGNDRTIEIMEGVLAEVVGLFPSPYVHIGGDECNKAGWKNCTRCQTRIRVEKLKNEEELQSYFVRRMEKFLNVNGKMLVGWDEILEGGLAPNAVVQSWRGVKGGIEAARAGHDVIMSPTSHCYFDYYQGPKESEPRAIGGNLTLEKVYDYEPVPEELTPEQSKYIMGVQGNLWGEYVATGSHAEYMSFPRGSALAEVGWSVREGKSWADFYDRLGTLLRRLDLMGVNYRKPDVMRVK